MAIKAKKLSVWEMVSAAEDVAEELVTVPEWGGVEILFRGMSLAALQVVQNVSIVAAQAGDVDQIVRILQATACDPESKLPVFVGESGANLLRTKNSAVLLRILNEGALVVLGLDEGQTAGKGSSSTETAAPATA
jgi:hypothetical protein